METLVRLKDNFFHYLSPAKRRRTVGPATPSSNAKPEFLTPHSEPQGIKVKAAVFEHITKKHYLTAEYKNPRKRAREDDDDVFETTLEETSLFDSVAADLSGITEDDSFAVSPDDSISQITPVAGSDAEDEDEDMISDELEEEEEIEEEEVVDELALAEREEMEAAAKVEEYLARQAEVEKAKAAGDWHADAIFVFERIQLLSFEELLPEAWHIDFPTLPHVLFTEDPDKQFINSNHTSSIRGVKALRGLFDLGIRVRDNLETGASTEKVITRGLKNYVKWSEKDGGFSKMRFLPVLTVVTAKLGESHVSLGTTITNQMRFLAEKHREHLAILPQEPGDEIKYSRTPPLLYGITVAKTIALFTTLDSSDPAAELRHLGHVDFKDKTMDVWNGFKLAFLAVMARDHVMSIMHELEPDDATETDVDL